jgi:methyl-accepting chemotaxis protein
MSSTSIPNRPTPAGSGFGEFFRYHGWLAPGVRWFRRISFPAKAAWVGLAFLTPLVIMLVYLWTAAGGLIDTTRAEQDGVAYAQPLLTLVHDAQNRRRAASTDAEDLPALQDKVKADFDLLSQQQMRLGESFKTADDFVALNKLHQELLTSPKAGDADQTFLRHDEFIDAALTLLDQVVNGSGLALDPDLDTYHLMNIALSAGPHQVENTARRRGLGAMTLKAQSMTPGRHDKLVAWQAVSVYQDQEVEGSYSQLKENFPDLAASLGMPASDDASEKFNAALKQQVTADTLGTDLPGFLATATAAVDAQHGLNMKALDALSTGLQARIDATRLKFEQQLAVAVAFVALAIYFMLAFYKVMMGGLQEVSEHLKQITAGNLTTAPKPWGRDEAAQLMTTLGDMQQSLRRIVAVVLDGAANVETASGEIASASMDLSQRTEQNAASLQQTSASMEQIAESVHHAAATVETTTQNVRDNAGAAERGGKAIHEVVQTMAGIRESSNKIGEIISVIDGIAFQTNILALNAAVEAARAGEHGRGFAVVASEVRALAGRSATAAREIKTLINSSIERVESGGAVVSRAGEIMREVVGNAERVAGLMESIATDTRMQNGSVGEVTTAVHDLDKSTQQNAALVEETAAAVGSLAEQAQRLSREVSFFKLA